MTRSVGRAQSKLIFPFVSKKNWSICRGKLATFGWQKVDRVLYLSQFVFVVYTATIIIAERPPLYTINS